MWPLIVIGAASLAAQLYQGHKASTNAEKASTAQSKAEAKQLIRANADKARVKLINANSLKDAAVQAAGIAAMNALATRRATEELARMQGNQETEAQGAFRIPAPRNYGTPVIEA